MHHTIYYKLLNFLIFFISKRLTKNLSNKIIIKLNYLIGLIFISGLTTIAYIQLNLDFEFIYPEYFSKNSTFFKWIFLEFFFVFFYAFNCKLTEYSRKGFYVFIAILAIFFAFDYYYTKPIYYKCKNIIKMDKFVYQSLDSSCGPAALATFLRLNQIDINEKEAAKHANLRKPGTTAFELKDSGNYILKNRDIRKSLIYKRINYNEIFKIRLPIVFAINRVHFIVLKNIKKIKSRYFFEMFDPSDGHLLYNEKEFKKIFSNKIILFSH